MKPVALYRYRNPLNTTLQFAGKHLQQRDGLLLKFDHNGQIGWGDCAPLPGFSHDSLEQNQLHLLAWCRHPHKISSLPAAAQFAVSSGQLMASQPVPTEAVPQVPLLSGTIRQIEKQALVSAYTAVKLKLARNHLADEIALVQRLQLARPQLRLRIDSNRGWTQAEAIEFAEHVDISRLDYVEEPCVDLNSSLYVHQQTGLPLALDETTQIEGYQYQRLPGVKALILKPTILGSIERLQQLIRAAHQDSIACVLSSSFESNLGLLALATLAQQLTPDQAPGLDTLSPLNYDLCQTNPWLPNRPLLTESQLEPLWP